MRVQPLPLRLVFLFMALASALGLRAAAQAGAPTRATAALTLTDTGIALPASVPAGYTAIAIMNAGTMPHEASFVKLTPGTTVDQLRTAAAAAINSDNPADFVAFQRVAQFYGGITNIAPGASAQLVLNLTPGTYGVADTEHFNEGLFTTFAVAGPVNDVAPPLADVTITERDFAFDAPATISAGMHTLEVRNAGAQPHELMLVTLDPGYTLQDVQTALQEGSGPDTPPPPWVHDYTGVDAQAPGLTQWATFDLAPGTYAMLCFMPDVTTGQPHAVEGMVGTFTVR